MSYHTVDIFCSTPGLQVNLDSHTARIMGTIDCRAYLPSKSSLELATSLIKEDILKTIKHRLELLSDEYVQNENHFFQQEFASIGRCRINLPRRVWYRNTYEITLCDYVLFSEKNEDSLERMGGLIGAGLGNLEALEEQQPEVELTEKSNLQRNSTDRQGEVPLKNQVIFIGALLVFLVAFIFSFLAKRS